MKSTEKKKGNMIVIGIIVVLVILILIFVMKRKKDTGEDDFYTDPITPPKSSQSAPRPAGRQYDKNFNPNKVVGRGFYGTNTAMIQKAVNRYRALLGLSPIKEDGDWGATTEANVSKLVSTPTSYAKVKAAVSNMYIKFGKADPYKAGKDVDGAQLISNVVTGKIFGG